MTAARRNFLRLVGATAVAATGAAAWLVTRWREEPGMSEEAAESLRAVIDTLIPRDEHPGALDLDIDQEILDLLRWNSYRRRIYRRGLEELMALSRRDARKPFHELPEDDRMELLLESSRGFGAAAALLVLARQDAFRSYYTSPAAFDMLDYRPPRYGYPRDEAQSPSRRKERATG